MAEEHAKLAPSSASIWVECTGQPTMVAGLPEEEETEASAEGTLVHDAAREILTEGALGYELTEEQRRHAFEYADAINRLREVPGAVSWIEERVQCPDIHPADVWGTPDAVIYWPDRNTLHIADLKYGHGAVEVRRNWQLTTYASGVIARLVDLFGEWGGTRLDLNMRVVFHIYQPRVYDGEPALRSWDTTANDLRAAFNRLFSAAHDVDSDRAVLKYGDHCKHCRARAFCPELREKSDEVIELMKKPEKENLTDAQLGEELARLMQANKAMQYRLDALTAQGEGIIQKGGRVPGFEMKRGRGRKVWDEKQLDALADYASITGVDLRKEGYITPAQAKAKKFPEKLIAKLSRFQPGAAKLSPVDTSKAEEVFNQ